LDSYCLLYFVVFLHVFTDVSQSISVMTLAVYVC
jgi:hypothetical protein